MLREYLSAVRAFPRNVRQFIIGAALLGISMSFFVVLANLALASAGFSKALIGDIQGLSSIGTLVASLPVAILHERFGVRKLLIAASFLAAAGLATFAFATHSGALHAAAFIFGIGMAVRGVVVAPFLVRNCEEKHRVYALGLSFTIEVAAGILGSALAGALPKFFPGTALAAIQTAIWFGVALMAASMIPFSGIREKAGGEAHGLGRNFREVLFGGNPKLYLKLLLPDAIIGIGAGITIPFLTLYLNDRFALGTSEIGGAISGMNACMLIGLLAAPALGRRFGLLTIVGASQLLSVPFMIALALTFDVRIAVMALLFRSALMNMGHPLARAFQMEMIPTREQTTLNSWANLSWNGTWILGTILGGRIIQSSGFTTSILTTSIIYFVSMILYLSFWLRGRYLKIGRADAASIAPQLSVDSLTPVYPSREE